MCVKLLDPGHERRFARNAAVYPAASSTFQTMYMQ